MASGIVRISRSLSRSWSSAAAGRQVGARWLSSSREKSSTESESADLSSIPWFGSTVENPTAERERPEVSRKQVGARWLASLREKSSTESESTDLSSIPWFGSTVENPASERERLEVSLQRLALLSKLGDNSQAPSFMFLPPKDNLLRKYFHWDNLSSAEKHKIDLEKARRSFRIHPTDCGSSQVQIALLTNKIKYMTKHMGTHRKDYHSRKGLEAMVSQLFASISLGGPVSATLTYEIGGLTKLRSLSLSRDGLIMEYPPAWDQSLSLYSLNLSYNVLDKAIPEAGGAETF